MREKTFGKRVTTLIEKHLPIGFVDYDFLCEVKKIAKGKKTISRREILIMAYMIGATAQETDDLLESKNYKKLYARNYEDAIWMFAIDKRKDLTEIFDIIFSTKCEVTCHIGNI